MAGALANSRIYFGFHSCSPMVHEALKDCPPGILHAARPDACPATDVATRENADLADSSLGLLYNTGVRAQRECSFLDLLPLTIAFRHFAVRILTTRPHEHAHGTDKKQGSHLMNDKLLVCVFSGGSR
jgi:hypothetical protein